MKTYFCVKVDSYHSYGFETLDRALCFITQIDGAAKKAGANYLPSIELDEYPVKEEGEESA